MSLWVHGVCDDLLRTVYQWNHRWPMAPCAATRPYMHKDGSLEDIVVKRAVAVSLHPKEMEHLVRILKALRPDWEFSLDLEQFFKTSFKKSRMLAGGNRLCTMVNYADDVKEILDLLLQARSGLAAPAEVTAEFKAGSFWDAVDK